MFGREIFVFLVWLVQNSKKAERWLTLKAGKTLVERRGGYPEHLRQDAPTDLSERSNRKKVIAQYLNRKISFLLSVICGLKVIYLTTEAQRTQKKEEFLPKSFTRTYALYEEIAHKTDKI